MDHVMKEDFAFKGFNLSNTSTYQLDATSIPEYEAAVVLWMVVGPCLLLVGGFGNVATVLVMRKMKDHHHSSQYAILMALALSDLLLLYVTVPRSIVRNVFNVDVWNEHVVACKVLRWLLYCSNTTSAWLVTLVTLQRTMAVLWPHRMRAMWTVRKTRVVIAVLAIAVWSMYFHLVLGSRITRDRRCGVGEGVYGFFFRHIFTWVDLTLSSLVPSLCLLICDVILSFRLFQATTTATTITSTTPSCSFSSTAVHVPSNVSGAHSSNSRRQKASRTTVMILTLSFTFVVLTMPIYGFYVFWYADEAGHLAQPPRVLSRYKLVQTVTFQLWLTNSAVNFLLYCVAGTRYRREFLNLLHCGTQSVSSTSSSSSSSVGEKLVVVVGGGGSSSVVKK